MHENVDYLFNGKSKIVVEIYHQLLAEITAIGEFEMEPKKTSIHITNGFAFAGVHPKKNWIDVNLVSNHILFHTKIIKIEQLSKNRFHNYFRLEAIEDIDSSFIELLKESYLLKGSKIND